MHSDSPVEAGYEVRGLIAEGGFGAVYRAIYRHPAGFEREVIIKVLRQDDAIARFRDEARMLASLNDRAIVGVRPPFQHEQRWLIVMDYVDGASLHAVTRGRGPLPPGVVASIAAEIGRVLHKAYHQPLPDGSPLRLVHRDIKPGNILVTASGEVRLVDFGLARSADSSLEHVTEVSPGGTPGFAAPELWTGSGGPQTDIYALGRTMEYLLVDHGPAPAPVATVTFEELPATDPVPPALRALIHRMTDPDPRARPTAKEVADDCRAIARTCEDGGDLVAWADAAVPPAVPRVVDDPQLPSGTWIPEHAAGPVSLPPSGVPARPAARRATATRVAAAMLGVTGALAVVLTVLGPSAPTDHADVIWDGTRLRASGAPGPRGRSWRVEPSDAGTRRISRRTAAGALAATEQLLPAPPWGSPSWVDAELVGSLSRPERVVVHDPGETTRVMTLEWSAAEVVVRHTLDGEVPVPSPDGVFVERYTLGDDGHPTRVQFEDPTGAPLRDRHLGWGYAFTHDAAGRVTRIDVLDADGQKGRLAQGTVALLLTWDDDADRIVQMHRLGYGDAPIAGPMRCASERWRHDADGVAEWRCMGLDGRPAVAVERVTTTAPGWATRVNDQLDPTDAPDVSRPLTVKQLTRSGLSDTEPVDPEAFEAVPAVGSLGCHGLVRSYEGDTRVVTCIGVDGQATPSRAGWTRRVEDLDESGHVAALRYQDPDGAPVVDALGVHRWDRPRDARGLLLADGPRWDLEGDAVPWRPSHVTLRFIRDAAGRVVAERHEDADGRPVDTRLGYAVVQYTLDVRGHAVDTATFDARNQPVSVGGHHRELTERTPQGWVVRRRWLDEQGQPAPNRRGTYGQLRTLDPAGRLLSVAFLDAEGHEADNNQGYARREVTLDARGHRQRVVFLTAAGARTTGPKGFAERAMRHDDGGNLVWMRHFGVDGEPQRDAQGLYGVEHVLDRAGRRVETRVLGPDDALDTEMQCAIWRFHYDDIGLPVAYSCFGALGEPKVERHNGTYHERRLTWDDRGLLRSSRSVGTDGRPMAGEDGVHDVRLDYDVRGNLREIQLRGVDDALVMGPQGYARLVQRWDDQARRTSVEVFGPRGEPVVVIGDHGPWSVRRFHYDGRGRVTRTTLEVADDSGTLVTRGVVEHEYDLAGNERAQAWRDAEGRLLTNPSGWAMRTLVRDGRGFVVRASHFDVTGAPAVLPEGHSGWSSTWNTRNEEVERWWIDGDGAPVEVAGGCAGWRQEHDATGAPTRRAWLDADGQPVAVGVEGYVEALRLTGSRSQRWSLRDASGAEVAIRRGREPDDTQCGW